VNDAELQLGTTLFIRMGVAAWLVGRSAGFRTAAMPLSPFAVQRGLHIAWSWIFLWRASAGSAFAEIVVLWLAIAATTAFLHWVIARRGFAHLVCPFVTPEGTFPARKPRLPVVKRCVRRRVLDYGRLGICVARKTEQTL
jgi:hypothetical protein